MKIDLSLIKMSPEMTFHVSKLKEEMQEIIDTISDGTDAVLEAEICANGSLTITAKPECEEPGIINRMTVNFLQGQGWNYL